VDELKILRAIAGAGRIAGLDVVPTFLGAHAIPSEFGGRPEAFVDLVAGEMLEAVLSDRLASFCDVFVDGGYFSADQARRILTKARDAGLRPKVHADELSDAGGSALAADVHAVSADHLNHASPEGVEAMSREGVIAVLLLDIPSWRHRGYRMGGNAVETVVKRGRVFDRRRLPE